MKEREEQDEYGQQWDYVEKQKRYSQFVQDRYKPRVSSEKKKQSEEMSHPSPKFKEAPDRSKYIDVGKNYLEYVHGLEKRKVMTPSQPVEPIKESRYVNYL